MNNINKLKITEKFINFAIDESRPVRTAELNTKLVGVDLATKFLLLTGHVMRRFRERFSINLSPEVIADYIIKNKDKKIFAISIKKDIVEKLYRVNMNFGELPAILFIKDNGIQFIVTTVYPDLGNEFFLTALAKSYEKISEHKESELVKQIEVRKSNAKKQEKKLEDTRLMNFLITNLFENNEEYQKFIMSDNKEEVMIKKIKKKVEIRNAYKGQDFDESIRDLEDEFSIIEVDVSGRGDDVVVENDFFVEAINQDDEFDQIMKMMEEDEF